MKYRFEYQLPNGKSLQVRRATQDNSRQTVKVWNSVVKEKKYTMGLNLLTENDELEIIYLVQLLILPKETILRK